MVRATIRPQRAITKQQLKVSVLRTVDRPLHVHKPTHLRFVRHEFDHLDETDIFDHATLIVLHPFKQRGFGSVALDWMRGTPEQAAPLMKPYAGEIEAWEVDAAVGNVKNNWPELMERVGLL